MLRRLVCATLLLTPAACAQGAEPADIAVDQAALAGRYERLEALALRIAELTEADDPARAEQLRRAVRQGRELALADRFAAVVELLRDERLAAADRDQQALANQLGQLMRLLLADPREAQAEAERKRLQALLKDVRRFIKQQRGLRNDLLDGRDPKEVADGQAELADRVDRAAGAPEGSPAGQSQNPSSPAPNGNAGGASPPPGDSGEPSPGGEPARDQQARRRLAQARREMQEAIDRLNESKTKDAESKQSDAQRRLEDAKREIEEALEQLREEEQVRMLTRLAERFGRMLVEQTEVYELTKSTHAAAPAAADRATRVAAAALARREEALARLADAALRLLRDDGRSLAFPATVEQLRGDIGQIADWLAGVRLGPATQRLEEDVIEQLESAIAAFKQAAAEKKEQQQQRQQSGEQGQPRDPQLVGLLAELRMVRSLQSRLLRRTVMWDEMVASGETSSAEAGAALRKLAIDQQRLSAAAESLAKSAAER